MRRTPELSADQALTKLTAYSFHILTWVGDEGYPISVAIDASIDPIAHVVKFVSPAGLDVPTDREISLTGSHIRPQPGYGYDERRHVTVWGRAEAGPDGRLILRGTDAWGWDEQELAFFEYSERSVGQSRRYFDALSAERGTPVRPRLSLPWLTLRATRLPFLTATIIPVLVGIAIAAKDGAFDPWSAALTVIGASFVQLGLNVANDVFDTLQGADDANVTPTQYSGGSRVLQYGLVSMRGMATLATAFYGIAIAIGLLLLATRGSLALLAIGVLGILISLFYTAPPVRLVYRGLGEIAVAIGFGPLMLLGAYVVQTRGTLSWEPFIASLPIALLVALILYVNEIPDRRGDARAGKRTLPVRLSKATVIRIYVGTVAAAFLLLVGGVGVGLLPVTVLIALLGVPLAKRVYDGLGPMYDNPYGLMAIMAVNIRLHMIVGAMILLAYLAVLLVGALAPGTDLFIG